MSKVSGVVLCMGLGEMNKLDENKAEELEEGFATVVSRKQIEEDLYHPVPLPYREPSPVLKSMMIQTLRLHEYMALEEMWKAKLATQVIVDDPHAEADFSTDALIVRTKERLSVNLPSTMYGTAAASTVDQVSPTRCGKSKPLFGDGVALNSMAHSAERWAEIDKIFLGVSPPSTLPPKEVLPAPVEPIAPEDRPLTRTIIDEWTRRR